MALPPEVLDNTKTVSAKAIERYQRPFSYHATSMEQLMRADRLPRRISWVSWTSER